MHDFRYMYRYIHIYMVHLIYLISNMKYLPDPNVILVAVKHNQHSLQTSLDYTGCIMMSVKFILTSEEVCMCMCMCVHVCGWI